MVKTDLPKPRRKPRDNKSDTKKNQCEIYANLSLLVTACCGFLLFCIDIEVSAYLDSSDYNLVF